MRKTKEQKGITLVALIITIIVLLILAVVAIGAVRNDGIIDHAKNAREDYGAAQINENTTLGNYLYKINTNVPGSNGGENSGLIPTTTVLESQGKVLSENLNTVAEDEYGNIIVVPAGFKITTDASKVTEGIVIEDCTETLTKGSQFVWIPTPKDGKVYTNKEKTEYKTINLDRYTFDIEYSSDENGEEVVLGTGAATPQGDAAIETYYTELQTSTYGNATALSIQNFKTSSTTNSGYYIGRYEAGNSNGTLVCKSNQTVYIDGVTQTEASRLSRNMYKDATTFTSDLVNSYAWDTAIVFIQTFGGCADYSMQNFSTSFANTGINTDKYCNIHDMSGNASEWTTETHAYMSVSQDTGETSCDPCVYRGGESKQKGGKSRNTSYRKNTYLTNGSKSATASFRPILYVI